MYIARVYIGVVYMVGFGVLYSVNCLKIHKG